MQKNKEAYMEDKIEVGEYVRTNKGNIGKIVEIRLGFNKDTQLYQDIYILDNGLWTVLDYIVKHSKIISEVVNIGDYVNGKLIHKIDKGSNYCYLYYGNCKTFVDYQIKTILTKESYMANCYKLGGENE